MAPTHVRKETTWNFSADHKMFSHSRASGSDETREVTLRPDGTCSMVEGGSWDKEYGNGEMWGDSWSRNSSGTYRFLSSTKVECKVETKVECKVETSTVQGTMEDGAPTSHETSAKIEFDFQAVKAWKHDDPGASVSTLNTWGSG